MTATIINPPKPCCPAHPGLQEPCWRCKPEERAALNARVANETSPSAYLYPPLAAETDTQQEVETVEEPTTITIEAPGEEVDDPNPNGNGKSTQPTLSDELFPAVTRRKAPMTKVNLSGSIEMTTREFLQLLDGAPGVGQMVRIAAEGHITKTGTAWKKRKTGSGEDTQTWWEQEGQPSIAVDDVTAIHLTGRTFTDD